MRNAVYKRSFGWFHIIHTMPAILMHCYIIICRYNDKKKLSDLLHAINSLISKFDQQIIISRQVKFKFFKLQRGSIVLETETETTLIVQHK